MLHVVEEVPCTLGGNHGGVAVFVWGRYLKGKAQLLYPEPEDVFPCDIIESEHCRPPTSYT